MRDEATRDGSTTKNPIPSEGRNQFLIEGGEIYDGGEKPALILKMVVVGGVEDGKKYNHFFNTTGGYAESNRSTVCNIAKACGIWDKICTQFPDDSLITDQPVMNALCTMISGGQVILDISHTESKTGGKTFCNIDVVEPVGGAAKQPQAAAPVV